MYQCLHKLFGVMFIHLVTMVLVKKIFFLSWNNPLRTFIENKFNPPWTLPLALDYSFCIS